MPMGIVGLIIAAIFAAAMSSISAELNALATATTIDFYRRHFKKAADDKHYVFFGRVATLAWGLFACVVAMYATNLGSLIEVVNKFGSFFTGHCSVSSSWQSASNVHAREVHFSD